MSIQIFLLCFKNPNSYTIACGFANGNDKKLFICVFYDTKAFFLSETKNIKKIKKKFVMY